MFLIGFFREKRRAAEARRRGIFRYWDGRAWRYADPPAAFLKLAAAGGDDWPRTLDAALNGADPGERGRAGRELARVARETFGVQPVGLAKGRPVGLTDAEAIDLLVGFLVFCRGLGGVTARQTEPAAEPA